MLNPPTLTALAPGSLLNNRFEVESLLNTGGFSLIYRALDHHTNRYVVVKECAPEGVVWRHESGQVMPMAEAGEELMRQLDYSSRYEAYVLSTLTAHGVSNITSYIADFEENGTHYIAMEEACGSDLHAWAQYYRQQGVPFPAQALEEILTAVLTVLQQVHECGFFHCDVKPANIVIDSEGNLKLIDFGAVRTAEQQHDGSVQVSPGFSPPEFYPGHRGQIGPWTDMYMLAALFYEIISGHAPEPANERAVVDRTPHLAANPALHKIYRDSFLISIDKALSLEHKDRFASAALWQEAYSLLNAAPKVRRSTAADLFAPGAHTTLTNLRRARHSHLHKDNSHGPLAGGSITAGAGSIKVTPTREIVTVSSGGSWGTILFFLLVLAGAAIAADKLGYITLPFELPF